MFVSQILFLSSMFYLFSIGNILHTAWWSMVLLVAVMRARRASGQRAGGGTAALLVTAQN